MSYKQHPMPGLLIFLCITCAGATPLGGSDSEAITPPVVEEVKKKKDSWDECKELLKKAKEKKEKKKESTEKKDQ